MVGSAAGWWSGDLAGFAKARDRLQRWGDSCRGEQPRLWGAEVASRSAEKPGSTRRRARRHHGSARFHPAAMLVIRRQRYLEVLDTLDRPDGQIYTRRLCQEAGKNTGAAWATKSFFAWHWDFHQVNALPFQCRRLLSLSCV